MPHVRNNGAVITIRIDGKRHEIPPGESEQPKEALEHPLFKALASERTPIMEPKGDDPKGEMIQRKGYRLVVDGKTPTPKGPKQLDEDGEAIDASSDAGDDVPNVWVTRKDKGEDPKTDKEAEWRGMAR